MSYPIFENDFFQHLALYMCTEHAKLKVGDKYIEVIPPKSVKPTKSFLEYFYDDGKKYGVLKVCYKKVCYAGRELEKSPQEYDNVIIFVDFDTGIFNNPHATYICGVPTSKYYWTGVRIDIDHYPESGELREILLKKVREPYCERERPGIYYCPPYFPNRQKLMDCNGKYFAVNATPEQASFLYDVFKNDIYIVHSAEEMCKPGTYPIILPLPDFKSKPTAPRFLIEAVAQYSIPPFRDIIAYMRAPKSIAVVYPDKSFETFSIMKYDDLVKVAIKVLETLLRKKYIYGYCETVKTLKYSDYILNKLIELNEKGVRCYNWSSES